MFIISDEMKKVKMHQSDFEQEFSMHYMFFALENKHEVEISYMCDL